MPENIVKELDNFVYAAAAIALVTILAFFDAAGAKTLAAAIGGALLIKIKGA